MQDARSTSERFTSAEHAVHSGAGAKPSTAACRRRDYGQPVSSRPRAMRQRRAWAACTPCIAANRRLHGAPPACAPRQHARDTARALDAARNSVQSVCASTKSAPPAEPAVNKRTAGHVPPHVWPPHRLHSAAARPANQLSISNPVSANPACAAATWHGSSAWCGASAKPHLQPLHLHARVSRSASG